MTGARLVELTDMTPTASRRPPLRDKTAYTPPEVIRANPSRRAQSPPPPPPPPLPPPPESPDDTKSSVCSATPRDVDVITAQIQHALCGGLTFSPSSTSSIASTLSANSTSIASETREELFRACLGASTVDVDELRRIVWAHGIPNAPWTRALAWKLLTGYLPPDRADWSTQLAARRAQYWATVLQVTVDPSARSTDDGDHPLSDAANSQWREFFKDGQLREMIQRDVRRTHPDLHKFAALRDNLERMLFVYAKMHPQLGYRQGMNELAAPFMLVFGDNRSEDLSDAEADAYYCFESIMTEMATCYAIKETAVSGIGKQLRELQALLRIKDPGLERHMNQCGVDPRFYGLRWIRLWLSQEFTLADCVGLWDSLLTSELRLSWLRYICVAMLIRIRDELLMADFAGCMKLLLHYPPCDISELLRIADRLRTSNVVIVRTARR